MIHLSTCPDTSNQTVLPKPLRMIHSLQRCLRQCLWCPTIMRTQWLRITSHISLKHIHRQSTKWSIPRQEVYNVYYTIAKWNFYLQGSDIIIHYDHKHLQKIPNGEKTNKVNQWSLELTTCNFIFQWISGA